MYIYLLCSIYRTSSESKENIECGSSDIFTWKKYRKTINFCIEKCVAINNGLTNEATINEEMWITFIKKINERGNGSTSLDQNGRSVLNRTVQ